jgi:hypothetical protein
MRKGLTHQRKASGTKGIKAISWMIRGERLLIKLLSMAKKAGNWSA